MVALTMLAALSLPGSGCGSKAASDMGIDDIDTTDVMAEIKAVLRVLFPDLTTEEIDEIAASLTLEGTLSLKAELEAIRVEVERFSKELFTTAAERVEQRTSDLTPVNGGFPLTLAPIDSGAFYDAARGEAWVELCGTLSGQNQVQLVPGDVTISVDGTVQSHQLECLHDGQPVDIVFLVDITGSMSDVIRSVRHSISAFVDAIVASNVVGTIGVVTFQDTVGVNVSFQQPSNGVERSPFFTPVPIDDATRIAELQRFVTRLEANSGYDAPENLAGAIDFSRNNVIGYTSSGAPNVIGDGVEDPPATRAWPALTNQRQIFVAFTDSTFHSDSRTPANSSLEPGFEPRNIADILQTLHATRSVVHVSDPSWVDLTTTPTGAATEQHVDSDFWAIQTGGVGEDKILGYSLVDLELVVVAETTGLLDISLNSILGATCRARFPLPQASAAATISVSIAHGGEAYSEELSAISY
jgi:hypothetical protein